ncbi:MAG: HTTM domain-containing protein, partial [Methylococcales bacterium]
SLLVLTGTQTQAWIVFAITLLGSVCFMVGLLTRVAGFVTLIGLISLWNRNSLIMDGDDAILRVMLFYLLLSSCGNAFSLDACRFPRSQRAEIWPLRMIRMQLALVYFISGWVKFHSPEWLNGSVLQIVLIHPEYSRWNWDKFMNQPDFLTALEVLSWIIMGWEILFPILIISRITRPVALAIGVIFHAGLLILMHLRLFSVIMLILYIAWIPPGVFLRK